jgi:glycosyltransferase involved in cell wall biosynthesis
MPLVSIVIPCFNGGGFLERAALSALQQDVSTEVILVDDGSTDDSARRGHEFMRAHPDRVRLILQPNQGQSTARNAGLLLANARFLCFLDVDDEMTPRFLSRAIKLLDADPSAVAVQGRVVLTDLHRNVEPWQQEVMESTMPGNLLMRAETVRQIGGFPTNPGFRGKVGGEDGAFRTELARFGQVLKLDLPFIHHRLRPGGHADLFLDRAVLQDGRVAFKYLLPEEQDGTLDRAIGVYRREVAQRMLSRLMENLHTQIMGVEAFQRPLESLRDLPSDLHPAEGFALYALAKSWPARGGIVAPGPQSAAAIGCLAAGCRDSNRGAVDWIAPADSTPEQQSLQRSDLHAFVQIIPFNPPRQPEAARLLLISSSSAATFSFPDPYVASLTRDGLLAMLTDSNLSEVASRHTNLSDLDQWEHVLSVRRLTVYRKLRA